jgi:hypothetical protein
MRRRIVSSLLALLGLLAIAGCGKSSKGAILPDKRPVIDVSSGPITGTDNFYDVKIDWFASDADGQVVKYIYAKDPPVAGDTAWVETRASEVDLFFNSNTPPNPLPQLGSLITEHGYHTFVVKAIDNEGLASAPRFLSFNSHTTAPSTQIMVPSPTVEVPVITVPSVTIQWVGTDPDGVLTQKPVKYKFKLVKASDINPDNPNAVTQQAVQLFFGVDADTYFASWDSVSGDTTEKFYQGLTPNTTYYFAVVAFDEAGAFEPRFNGNSNVLAFRPTLNRLGPVITVFNQFFSRTQLAGGVSLEPSRIYPLEFPADNPIPMNWSAEPGAKGAQITGFRWTLDIEGQDISNETPRRDDTDLAHWSAWSLSETSIILPKFTGSLDTTVTHFFYLEARDNVGFVSLFTLRLIITKPNFSSPLLVVDDLWGTKTERSATPPYISYKNPYPMEAEQDSFYFAHGGFPDSLRILAGTPGAVSVAGSFSEFSYDTLDYHTAWPIEGVSLDKLGHYYVVAWYTDQTSSGNHDQKFGGIRPSTAIRLINSVNRLNTLAVYLAEGGKAFLFGDGIATAIANGYYSRISGNLPRYPYESGEDVRNDILRPGDFLYDFIHLQSELNLAATEQALTANAALIACLPYLPQYNLPAGQPVPADRSLDPRVGPSAQKTLDHGWGGLPRLTLAFYRSSNPNPALRKFKLTNVISRPLFITEGTGANFRSVVDTLYLCQAALYDPNNVNQPTSDGYPNAIDYYGSQHGELVWFGFPLYVFEPDQARQCVRTVLTHLGLTPVAASDPLIGAHPASVKPGGIVAAGQQGGGGTEVPLAVRRTAR